METTLNKLSNFHLTGKRERQIYSFIIILCCTVFLYSGTIKIWNLEKITQFQRVLTTFPLIGNYAKFLSYAIPGIEYLVCLLLIFRKTNRTGLQLFSGIMIIFTLYIMYLFIRGGDLPCLCGGLFEKLTWRQHIGANILLISVAQLGLSLGLTSNKRISYMSINNL